MSNPLPCNLTAVATLGEVGASYAVYEKNWFCSECKHENYARKQRCHRCRSKKGKPNDSLVVLGDAENNLWREAADPKSGHIYYYHTVTRETKWERPIEMGPAPHSTGWFGRGAAGVDHVTRLADQNKRFMKRMARKQIDELPNKNSRLEGAYEYNIWYDRHIGDHWDDQNGKEPAATRCVLETDAGRTKADGMNKSTRHFCLHFIRGMCARGEECTYYHRLPLREDEVRIGMLHDCFGRDRHATDRDDMSGVGNFTRNSRTLYIGGLKDCSAGGRRTSKSKKLEDDMYKQFGEWGEVENINIIHRLNIAFVRYRHRIYAEVAKEAMGNQNLGSTEEVLNLRWAFDDPNPIAKEAGQRSDHDAIVGVLKAHGVSTTMADYNYPSDYNHPSQSKKQKVSGDEVPAILQASEGVSAYPNTDEQYKTATAELSYAD